MKGELQWLECRDELDVGRDMPGGRQHILPLRDTREHIASATCWCRPEQDVEHPSMFRHNALDGRDAFERGERRLS